MLIADNVYSLSMEMVRTLRETNRLLTRQEELCQVNAEKIVKLLELVRCDGKASD